MKNRTFIIAGFFVLMGVWLVLGFRTRHQGGEGEPITQVTESAVPDREVVPGVFDRSTGALMEAVRPMLSSRMGTRRTPALQVGMIYGKVAVSRVDRHWMGDVSVTVEGAYQAPYGFPASMLDSAYRFEQRNDRLALVLMAPRLTAPVAMDLRSIQIRSRERSGVRTYDVADRLAFRAQRGLGDKAWEEAERKLAADPVHSWLAAQVMRDMVFDLLANLSPDDAPYLSQRIDVCFEDGVIPSGLIAWELNPRQPRSPVTVEN